MDRGPGVWSKRLALIASDDARSFRVFSICSFSVFCFALLAGIVGCSSGTKSQSETKPSINSPASREAQQASRASGGATYGGRITLAIMAEPKSFNPIMAKETSTTAITGYLFEGLTRTNAQTTEVEPHLAHAWEVSPDGLRWIFHLRTDVQWSDGKPFTSEDVVFTFNDLINNPEIPSSAGDIFRIDGQPIQVRALDAATVEFILPKPFAPFLRAMAQEIVPAHKLRDQVKAGTFTSAWGLDTPLADLVGTGPFKLAEYRPAEYARFERNPNYWRKSAAGERLPYLNEVKLMVVQTEDVALLKFQEGELDAYSLRGSDYKILKPQEAQGHFTVYELGPDFGTSFLCFNQNPRVNPETGQAFLSPEKQRWFTDIAFRRASAHAIDKASIINIVMDGLGYPQESAMSPSAGFFYNASVPIYPYDIAKAKQILQDAGYIDRDGDGIIEDAQGAAVKFTLVTNAQNTQRVQIANVIRKDLESLGMQVTFMQLEFNTLVSKLNATFDWDAVLLGFTGGIEPHFGRNVWHSSGHLHMWSPNQDAPVTEWESEIDRLFDAGVQELDEAKRKVLYDRWQVIVAEQLPLIYTVLAPEITAVRNRFGNLKPTAYGGALHNIEELYVTAP